MTGCSIFTLTVTITIRSELSFHTTCDPRSCFRFYILEQVKRFRYYNVVQLVFIAISLLFPFILSTLSIFLSFITEAPPMSRFTYTFPSGVMACHVMANTVTYTGTFFAIGSLRTFFITPFPSKSSRTFASSRYVITRHSRLTFTHSDTVLPEKSRWTSFVTMSSSPAG